MHLSGHYSNPSAPLSAVLGLLGDGDPEGPQCAAEDTGAYPTPASGRPTPPQLRWGAIQAAILIVLGEAERPMRVREVHARVEGRLGLKVSYHTVGSFLIAAGKSPLSGVLKVGYGTYRAAQ
jgi:hypothetical protein